MAICRVRSKMFYILWDFMQISFCSTLKGASSNELTLFPSLFSNFSSILYWRIDLSVTNSQSVSSSGVASLVLKKNLLPSTGHCYCQETTGTSLLTYFNVICRNWIDPDGSISSYQFMGKNYLQWNNSGYNHT